MNKWICKIFGCNIIEYKTSNYLYNECKRCGAIVHVSNDQKNKRYFIRKFGVIYSWTHQNQL